MEVAVRVTVPEFHFDSATTTPCMTPKRLGADAFELYCYYYTSAPSSPTAATTTSVPFLGDEKPAGDEAVDDFAFDCSGHLEKGAPPPELTTADKLFEQGKIRTLKSLSNCLSAPAAERGRERTPISSSSPFPTSRRGSRSLSPLRAGAPPTPPSASILCTSKNGSDGSSRKWRLKDLLLFRSASEGRATGDRSKDPLRNYTPVPSSSPLLSTKHKKRLDGDESKGSAMRGTARGGASSPHAMHYAANRAAAEEMKKKTALPYRQGFFSFLRLDPTRDRHSDRRARS